MNFPSKARRQAGVQMPRWAAAVLPALALSVTAAAQVAGPGAPPAQLVADPKIAAAVQTISAERVQADISKLVSFGTRSTISSMSTDLPPGQGVLAAADWIEAQYKEISAACGNCLEVERDDYTEPAGTGPRARILQPTRLVNVYAILHGSSSNKAAPWTLVTGHYDSRATDVMDAKATAPGANDDASGVAVSIESARALSHLKLPGTIVFAAVAGEEQGLNGSRHLAKLARSEGWPLVAVLNDDIVGGDTTPGDTFQDKNAVRVFSESVPSAATPEQAAQTLGLGAEDDSPSRELARSVAEISPLYLPAGMRRPPARNGVRSMMIMRTEGFHPVLVNRRDRYLRGGDHTSFNAEGFAAVRFTEWRENFDHQHQTLRTENGTEYGDTLKFVDFSYVANVGKLNASVLASLAEAPGEPGHVQVLTHALDNNTELTWEPPAYFPPGTTYEVVWRDTTATDWQHSVNVGNATRAKLAVSKDNVLFGVRAVAAAEAGLQRSLPVPPLPAR